ncbi:hypothetical protein [Actinomadura madurae]|uniref:hypothetical protein n=1 Tax=Actinomadura madurae TaxID=1993 RepID=UPI0020D24100|nr:hypothetical protein [Actinomadura madurae]MCQ0020621.1 hypothetical protein [Actinomadura madurae]
MEPRPWTSGKATRSPFVLPSGLRGHLAGRVMFRMNRQDEVAALLDVRPGRTSWRSGTGREP